jgi:anti-sigma regulatory factor (Ser/Thr protein kinase)
MSEASRRFEGSPLALLEARRFVRATMLQWGRRVSLKDVEVIVAELVNNAIDHTQSEQITLRLQLRHSRLRIEVTDSDPDHLARMRFELGVDHGNGLRIVDAVATSWGCTPDGTTKIVWAELDLNQPVTD